MRTSASDNWQAQKNGLEKIKLQVEVSPIEVVLQQGNTIEQVRGKEHRGEGNASRSRLPTPVSRAENLWLMSMSNKRFDHHDGWPQQIRLNPGPTSSPRSSVPDMQRSRIKDASGEKNQNVQTSVSITQKSREWSVAPRQNPPHAREPVRHQRAGE